MTKNRLQIVKFNRRPSLGSVLIKNPESGVTYTVEMAREPHYLLRVDGIDGTDPEEEIYRGDVLVKVASEVLNDEYVPSADDVLSTHNTKFTIEE